LFDNAAVVCRSVVLLQASLSAYYYALLCNTLLSVKSRAYQRCFISEIQCSMLIHVCIHCYVGSTAKQQHPVGSSVKRVYVVYLPT